jgi:uncharacterized zinc-type alcohol dehydrogenase-like protein
VITRSNSKEDAAQKIGAKDVLVSTNDEAMEKAAQSFDLIIDTAPVKHDLSPYTPLLDIDGTIVIVGQVGPMEEISTLPLIFGRRRVAGSLIGGIKETQEVLDFCAAHDIHPECKTIKMNEINDAFAHLAKGDVAYRFVIDMQSLNIES